MKSLERCIPSCESWCRLYRIEGIVVDSALYLLSLALAHQGVSFKRILTIGAIAFALADLLRDLPGSSVSTIWAVGFSMSPSYTLRHALESIFMIFHLKSWPWSQELPLVLCGLSALPILLCPKLEHGRICRELV